MSNETPHPIIGWEQTTPVPDGHRFATYLQNKNGRLHFSNLDLTSIFTGEGETNGFDRTLPSPLEVVYLPIIRDKIRQMNEAFAEAIGAVEYNGRFRYAYASKANAAEEVIRTTLGAGAEHEMSSTVDVDIAKLMIQRGLLPSDRPILANGFKPAGSPYSKNLLSLRQQHEHLIPIIEDIGELAPFLASGQTFELGLRQKTYGKYKNQAEMDAANSRFGMDSDDIWKTADYIHAAPNLSLVMYHAMVGSQLTDIEEFVQWLSPGMEMYARLRKRFNTLSAFNWGGGTPVPMTLDFSYDYVAFARHFLTTMKEICAKYDVPEPDVMGEFGRYTTSEHGAHLFKVLSAKENGSDLPWYIIDGSIMSSFPDVWALGEHFIVLPLNHLDQPFQQVQLGGITCDSDDVYPPKGSASPLYLPVETDDLYLGFFSVGAYQEMLGGVKGSKHCVLPEAYELVVDNIDGKYQFEVIHGQTPEEVLKNLGYDVKKGS